MCRSVYSRCQEYKEIGRLESGRNGWIGKQRMPFQTRKANIQSENSSQHKIFIWREAQLNKWIGLGSIISIGSDQSIFVPVVDTSS